MPTLLDAVDIALRVLAALSLVPVTVLLAEVLAALPTRRRSAATLAQPGKRPSLGVIVPAHDEAGGIESTLRTIVPQLAAGDRLVVVADNCSDDTAPRAAAAGAEVVERHEPGLRGKGYALDAGVRHLQSTAPPAVVVMIDADCALHPGSLDALAAACMRRSRPAQALDLMRAAPGAGIGSLIAEFAWIVKNEVRPLGASRLGLPCPLMGTGMAFPWALIRSAPLASGHLVEDMRLGLDMAAAGAAPVFCPDALVTSFFPLAADGIAAQRARWERGHVGVLLRDVPQALWLALRLRRPALVAMAIDLAVPPLSLLLLALVVQTLTAGMLFVAGGTAVPLLLALIALGLLALAIALAWARFARHVISFADLAAIPRYVLGKLPLYARMFRGAPTVWTRARRDHDE